MERMQLPGMFRRPLFKTQHFEEVKNSLADGVLRTSENSVVGILVLWDVVAHHFYDVNIGGVIKRIERALPKEDFIGALALPYTPDIDQHLENSGYFWFVARFFDFLWSRLPMVFALNPIRVKGATRRPSPQEIKAVTREAVVRWARKYPEMYREYRFSREYSQIRLISCWFVPASIRVRVIYRQEWFWHNLERHFPDLSGSENVKQVVWYVLDQSFPMFLNALEAHYRLTCRDCDLLHWFTGTTDF